MRAGRPQASHRKIAPRSTVRSHEAHAHAGATVSIASSAPSQIVRSRKVSNAVFNKSISTPDNSPICTCRRCTRVPPCAFASCCTRSIKEATMEYSCTPLLAFKFRRAFVEEGGKALGEVGTVRDPRELGELCIEMNVKTIHPCSLVEKVLRYADRRSG